MSPPRWQKRAEAQRISASFSINSGPSISFAIFSKGSLSLASAPSKFISHGCCRKTAFSLIARTGIKGSFASSLSFFRKSTEQECLSIACDYRGEQRVYSRNQVRSIFDDYLQSSFQRICLNQFPNFAPHINFTKLYSLINKNVSNKLTLI